MGEMRDGSSASYAGLLKSRLIGENPCDVDRLFRKIKQFGGPSRQGGGVSGVEIALWDLAGKAYGVPVYQMLGGKFRRRVELYCDQGRTPPEQCETAARRPGPAPENGALWHPHVQGRVGRRGRAAGAIRTSRC